MWYLPSKWPDRNSDWSHNFPLVNEIRFKYAISYKWILLHERNKNFTSWHSHRFWFLKAFIFRANQANQRVSAQKGLHQGVPKNREQELPIRVKSDRTVLFCFRVFGFQKTYNLPEKCPFSCDPTPSSAYSGRPVIACRLNERLQVKAPGF